MNTAEFVMLPAGPQPRRPTRRTLCGLAALVVSLSVSGFLAPLQAQPAPSSSNKPRKPPVATKAVSPPPAASSSAKPARESAPRPPAEGPAESAYRKYADEVLAPVIKHQIAEDDLKTLKAAFAAVGKGEHERASAMAATMSDPVAKKIVTWYQLTRGFGSARDYRAFLDKNPSWPQRSLLVQRLEEALFKQGGTADEMRGLLIGGKPETTVGEFALASAYLAGGDRDKARQMASKAWRQGDIPESLERAFLDRFAPLLTAADHKWRLDRYLMSDRRWVAERNAQASYVRRIIPLLSDAEKKKAEARLAVYLRSSSATKLMDALPADDKADWGLAFQRAQLLRRQNNSAAAVKILLSAPTDPKDIVSPDDWWEERLANAYQALDQNNHKLAYELVRDAGPLTVNPLKDQRFMAGWIAFRYLKDHERALRHFKDMREAADGPLSRARADYWTAKTLTALGRDKEARPLLERATRERDTFHGLLAFQKLHRGPQTIEITPPARSNDDEVKAIRGLDSLRAAVIADKAGLGGSVVRPFVANARTVRNTESWSGLVAHMADAMGDTQMSLRISKNAIADGHNLLIYGYPTRAFPSYEALRKPPELAFLLGIARQETEFNTQTVSGAGARGLLQVMPVTAQHVCRDHKVKCDIPRLLSDKVYNTMIGSAYLGDRMAEFGGNYVLTLAGYNAGPDRARQWMRQFGDPRDPNVDPVDWIERIPFEETRNYVAKVLSNIQIYRARMGQQPAMRLDEDLGRKR